ncbi:MAG: gamma-butyrobetaine hydroxylase-like domain-containing protein [Ottowia sp.]
MTATSPPHVRPNAHPPQDIVLHTASRVLELIYPDGLSLRLPFELLRVYSPSAEVQGHSPDQAVLQTGKRDVLMTDIEAVGHYAIRPTFSDGHSTGIYTWDYLRFLGEQQEALWQQYEQRLAAAGVSRDAPMPAKAGRSCHSH